MLNNPEGKTANSRMFGRYEVRNVVTNEDMAGWRNWNGDPIVTKNGTPLTAEMIWDKLGIRRRGIASDDETIPYMLLQTAQDTLKGRKPDLLFVSTSTPVGINLATHVEQEFDFKASFKTDVHYACTGFAHILHLLHQNYKKFKGASVAILPIERLHPILADLRDPEGPFKDEALSQTIFTDRGAGMYVESLGDDLEISASGEVDYVKGADFIRMPTPFADLVREPYIMFPIMASEGDRVEQRGGRVTGTIQAFVPDLVHQVAKDAGFEFNKGTVVVPHMASRPVLDRVEEGLPELTVYRDLEDGNSSSGSIPKALEKAINEGVITATTPVVGVGFGAGITIRAVALRFPFLK